MGRPPAVTRPAGLHGGCPVPSTTRATGRTVTAILTDAGVLTPDQVQAGLERPAGCRVNPSVATRKAIRAALEEVLGLPPEASGGPGSGETASSSESGWDRSGTSFLLFHLSRAITAGASEIHFLPHAGELRV